MKRLIEGTAKAVFIEASGTEIADPIIKNATVLCGSFNPLHQGHTDLLKVAQRVTQKEQAIFEVSVKNCDKGLVDEETLIKRVAQFKGMPLLVTLVPLFY